MVGDIRVPQSSSRSCAVRRGSIGEESVMRMLGKRGMTGSCCKGDGGGGGVVVVADVPILGDSQVIAEAEPS